MQATIEALKLKADSASIATTALNDFKSLPSNKLKILAENVVAKSLQDQKLSRQGAKLCWEIIRIETELTDLKSEKIFRKNVLNLVQMEYKSLSEKPKRNKLAYVTFLCSMFDLYRINEKPLLALIHPVLDCLTQTAHIKFAKDDDYTQCLVTQLQFIGQELDKYESKKMGNLFILLRELFLNQNSSQLSRLMLLEVIELRSGKWKLTPGAHKYYYGSN